MKNAVERWFTILHWTLDRVVSCVLRGWVFLLFRKSFSNISFIHKSEVEGQTARAHVNILRRFSPELKETRDPIEGAFLDTRRIIRTILDDEEREDERYFRIRAARRRGVKWVNDSDLPEVVVKAYDKVTKSKHLKYEIGMRLLIFFHLI